MPKTRALSIKFRDSVKTTLNQLCEQEKGAKKTICELCECSSSLVTKWCSFDVDTLPNFEDLYKIADHYNVTVDWFLTNHTDLSFYSRISTYSEAFRALIPLAERCLIQSKDIDDVILNYLLEKYMKCVYSGIAPEELTDWCRKILKDFNLPITVHSSDQKLCTLIIEIENGIKSIDDDVTYRNLAHALLDQKLIDEIESLQQPQPDIPEKLIVCDGPPEEEQI